MWFIKTTDPSQAADLSLLAVLVPSIWTRWYENPQETVMMELQELGWPCLVALFLASLLIVLGWLCQYCMTLLQLRGSWSRTKQVWRDSSWPRLSVTVPSLVTTVRSFLQRLRAWRGGGPPSEAGVKGLLISLFSYKSIREQCQRTWVKALNEQACRHGVSYLTELETRQYARLCLLLSADAQGPVHVVHPCALVVCRQGRWRCGRWSV